MNVEGGGTLRLGDGENESLLSLEWLEPASPYVNLNQDVLTFDCPCCRKAEPVALAFNTSPTTTNDECPVCLETAECQVLACGHSFCNDCWNRCRLAAMRPSVDLEEMDETEMKKERAKRDRLFTKKRRRDGESQQNWSQKRMSTRKVSSVFDGNSWWGILSYGYVKK